MIKTKSALHEYLTYEKKLYLPDGFFSILRMRLSHSPNYLIWHYQRNLRLCEYHFNTGHKIRCAWFRRRKNKEGARLGIDISPNCVEKGLHIYHYGSIIIHVNAHIGENLCLHGNNCIGNKGVLSPDNAPEIGSFCDLGTGACVIGGISLGSHITIGANAVVTKSYPNGHLTLGGIPAHPL